LAFLLTYCNLALNFREVRSRYVGSATGLFWIEYAEFLYKATDYWYLEHERTIRWDDPGLDINWGQQIDPTVSGKDGRGKTLASAELSA